MRDYEELVKRLHKRIASITGGSPLQDDLLESADAIEELKQNIEQYKFYLQDAINDLRSAHEKEPKWISVEERLPEDGKPVNIVWLNRNPPPYYQVIMDKPFTATGIYFNGKWYWYSCVCEDYLREYGRWEPDAVDEGIQITHWMPLPEPPKEET